MDKSEENVPEDDNTKQNSGRNNKKDNGQNNNDPFIKLLFSEYEYLTKMYLNNESLGENRVNLFLALTSAALAIFTVISGPGALFAGSKVDPKYFLVALGVLLLFGWITLRRIITRNLLTTDYVNKLDTIRRAFVNESDERRMTLAFDPYQGRKVREIKAIFSIDKGGLLETVVLMNSLIVVGLVVSAISILNLIPMETEIIGQNVIYVAVAIIVLICGWAIQMTIVRRRYNAQKKKENEVTRAAGGLVWQKDNDARRIGIIFRSRHQEKKGTLPKGKLRDVEGWKEAAMREVCEEIGCFENELKLGDFADGIVYPVNGKPKVVLFWHMEIKKDYKKGKRDEEAKQVKWLPIEEAIQNLEYQREANLLREYLKKNGKNLEK